MNVRSCLINYWSESCSDEFKAYLNKHENSNAKLWHFEGFNDNDDERCVLFIFEYPVNVDVKKFENVKFVDTVSSINDLLYYLESNSFDHYQDMNSTFQLDLKK